MPLEALELKMNIHIFQSVDTYFTQPYATNLSIEASEKQRLNARTWLKNDISTTVDT